MDTGALLALGGAAVLMLIVLCVLLGALLRGRRQLQEALAAARADMAMLRTRLDEIEAAHSAAAAPSVVPATEYLITSAGVAPGPAGPPSTGAVGDRLVLSATLGEPLLKVISFGYGVRRALAPETRNRILFEMRREVRRSRKQRKREARHAVRQARRQAAA